MSERLKRCTNNVNASTNARVTGPALEAMYQFLLWLVPMLEKFPRSRKYPRE